MDSMDPISPSADSRAVALARRVLRIEAAAVAALKQWEELDGNGNGSGVREVSGVSEVSEVSGGVGRLVVSLTGHGLKAGVRIHELFEKA